jgi:hypothetical protein
VGCRDEVFGFNGSGELAFMKVRSSTDVQSDRLSIGVAMLLIAGAALGFWLAVGTLKKQAEPGGASEGWFAAFVVGLVFVLGGMSLVGPPLLLRTSRKQPWGAGRFLWFTQGTAAWLLWPPAIYHRATAAGNQDSMSGICFFYGTPPMALYITLTLLASGQLTRSRRRRMRRSWQETFGLLLGLIWACTGLFIISLFYREDFK